MDTATSDQIRSHGWTQGSILNGSDFLDVGLAPVEYVVVNHPCDVVFSDFSKEPKVYLIPVVSLDAIDGNLTHGKNPRRLQLLEPDLVDIRVSDLVAVPRQLLANSEPLRQLQAANTVILGRWLASRWARSAFPDAFNARLSKVKRPLVEALKNLGVKVSGLYFASDFSELPEGTNYQVVVLLTMRGADYSDAASIAEAEELAEAISELIDQCDGLEALDARVQSESNTTLEEIRLFRRWDTDSVTFRGEHDAGTLAVS